VTIRINDKGDEIERVGDKESGQVLVTRKGDSVTIKRREKANKREKCGVTAIGTDSKRNTYIVTPGRRLTEKESNATRVSGSFSYIDRSLVDFDIVENIDYHRLLVFNPEGKIIAETRLTTFCDRIYISGNRLFIIDGDLNQRILEYEMNFKNKPGVPNENE
ncbi:MAG: hypothetical protein GY940_47535, partial [bacterium]|nr:hypothetical protein [bacterium]